MDQSNSEDVMMRIWGRSTWNLQGRCTDDVTIPTAFFCLTAIPAAILLLRTLTMRLHTYPKFSDFFLEGLTKSWEICWLQPSLAFATSLFVGVELCSPYFDSFCHSSLPALSVSWEGG
ncbi:uncharacterized protein K460DRAFT_178075 [Cucurbitaria berberidis CBS 394.84]|uniref:Uncharacterized protein n=1 Tax=Cucurbitaria berberidis CBS 394.84 TaxID=1168544 RepID=A0A9P4GB78_9PLEO|nr:uncharacterized protein K460DRAFT_178075 [Cucurbitaria berberidis CBS 394.84]KAF1842050.1 hypothetical protein K460DRAFT_178075 [Cucurbitaria berberidis CBS 394.84]